MRLLSRDCHLVARAVTGCAERRGGAVGALSAGRLAATARTPLRTVRPRLPLPVTFRAEDSPRGLWRSLGKRVGLTPSRVRIPHPPQLPLGETPLTLIHVPS